MARIFLTLLVASAAALAQDPAPVIGPFGVLHGANYQPAGAPAGGDFIPSAGIAPGAIFLLKGADLGPAELVAGASPFSLRLPDAPGGTEVHVRSLETGIVMQAPIVHAWAFQVSALLPPDFPLGDAEVQVWYGGQASNPAPLRVVRAYPAVFIRNQTGAGRGIVQNYVSASELPLNGLTRSARPGQYIVLWGTGLGQATAGELRAQIGAHSLPFDYAGPAPGLDGVDQFNLRLPDDLDVFGCYVRLWLYMGETSTDYVTIAIAPDGGACSHPWGLSPERLAEIEAGGRATYVRLDLSDGVSASTGPGAPPSGATASGAAFALDESGLENYADSGFSRSNIIPASRFTCTFGAFPNSVIGGMWWDTGDFAPVPPPPAPENPPVRGANVGFPWLLTGPTGQTLELPETDERWFDATGAAGPVQREAGFLAPGTWTLTVPAGDEIGPLEIAAAMPAVPEVSVPAVIRRGEDFAITWPVEPSETPLTATAAVSFSVANPELPDAPFRFGFGCPVSYTSGRAEFRFSGLASQLEGVDSVDLTFRVSALRTQSGGAADRIEARGEAFRTWIVPLE